MENVTPTAINTINNSSSSFSNDNVADGDEVATNNAEWRAKFIQYYTTNAPSKVSLVNDKLMNKFQGKYHILWKNLVKKYGPPGQPIEIAIATPNGNGKKVTSTSDIIFKEMIDKATPTSLQSSRDDDVGIIESKANSNSQNGLETSTFTVCARIRPLLLGREMNSTATATDDYAVVVPGKKHTGDNEELLLFTPKVSVTGKAKLDTLSHEFDYVFGPTSTNDEIYTLACAPLVQRALDGQVGVIFAYGQTGSGKTHTISGILDILSTTEIFSDMNTISFSYIEMLGRDISDCLPADKEDNTSSRNIDGETKKVQIGEGLDGAVLIRNMQTHTVNNAEQFSALIQLANATRSTAATAKNETSSRSHGVALVKVTNKMTGVEGSLYVIDLAGSESAKDSKDHDSVRMKETKEINSSLMTLKSCIRARTTAAGPGQGRTHIPYRSNKLTLLMKDIFDVGCSRLCSTVVIATCSPLLSDIGHTKNTVKYAAPLRVAVAASSSNTLTLELDVFDPALWNNSQMVSWVESIASETNLDAKKFVNTMTGVQFCALSENVFYERAQDQLGESEDGMKIAKSLYMGLWTLIVDAKTRKRRPDGSIITVEQEEEERKLLEEATIERARVWAEREKNMHSP